MSARTPTADERARYPAVPQLNGDRTGTDHTVICDRCNGAIAKHPNAYDCDLDEAWAYVYAVIYDGDAVVPRYTTCEHCGPISVSPGEDEIIATVEFDYRDTQNRPGDGARGGHVFANAHLAPGISHVHLVVDEDNRVTL